MSEPVNGEPIQFNLEVVCYGWCGKSAPRDAQSASLSNDSGPIATLSRKGERAHFTLQPTMPYVQDLKDPSAGQQAIAVISKSFDEVKHSRNWQCQACGEYGQGEHLDCPGADERSR